MAFTVGWTGLREVGAALERRSVEMRTATGRAVTTAAHAVEASMKLHAGEGGRHKKGTPTPAVQGAGPAVITGTLRRSIEVGDLVPLGLFGFEIKVGPTAIYGRRIELEYDYPYAGPGFADVIPELPAMYAEEWRRVWSS